MSVSQLSLESILGQSDSAEPGPTRCSADSAKIDDSTLTTPKHTNSEKINFEVDLCLESGADSDFAEEERPKDPSVEASVGPVIGSELRPVTKATQQSPSGRTLPPMLQHYLQVKAQYPEHLVLYQVGDFYEVFFDDARVVSETVQIRLTSRDKDQTDPVPMCGVPIHALENYLPKILTAGHSCVIISQADDEKRGKGMVKREISRIVTPGVRFQGDGLDERRFNFLAAAAIAPRGSGAIGYVDVSTGHLRLQFLDDAEELIEALQRIRPSEVIIPSTLYSLPVQKSEKWVRELRSAATTLGTRVLYRPFARTAPAEIEKRLKGRGAINSVMGNSVTGDSQSSGSALQQVGLGDEGSAAVSAVLDYVDEVSFGRSPRLASFRVEQRSNTVAIDAATRRNLELTETRIDGERKHSLLGSIDSTRTAMGSRLLGDWVLMPSSDLAVITARQDAIADLMTDPARLEALRALFAGVRDLDRLVSRITSGRATPRDLRAVADSTDCFDNLKDLLKTFSVPLLQALNDRFDPLGDLRARLTKALVDDPPAKVSEGGIFRIGYNDDVDRLRRTGDDGHLLLAELEARERTRSGIGSLKIRYNNVFGYYLEVGKAHMAKVPPDFERRQTLANAERFVTPELKKLESEIISAKSRQIELEKELFVDLRNWTAEQSDRLQRSSHLVAELDCLAALAFAAARNNYVRPEFVSTGEMTIEGGRHPVVEQVIGAHNFVANDIRLDRSGRRFAVLTGPNMGGKSTYLRQAGLIQLLAQIGSFVPARRARLTPVDRIFTRIGAADDISRGDSTFMVEMRESAAIIRKARSESLVLIDEVGRGTATADGLAIATAIAEWLADTARCATIFATHFHELTDLAVQKDGVFCLAVGVVEEGRQIVFTHRIEERAADRSYGIEVARLAGLPERLLKRAEQVLAVLNREHRPQFDAVLDAEGATGESFEGSGYLDTENSPPAESGVLERRIVVEKIRELDTDGLTPLGALVALAELKKLVEDTCE